MSLHRDSFSFSLSCVGRMLQTQSSSAFPEPVTAVPVPKSWGGSRGISPRSCAGAPNPAHLPVHGQIHQNPAACSSSFPQGASGPLNRDLNVPKGKISSTPTVRMIPQHHHGCHPSSGAGPGLSGMLISAVSAVTPSASAVTYSIFTMYLPGFS